MKCTVMGNLKEALTVHYDFPLLEMSLYITFKIVLIAAGEPIPLEKGRLGELVVCL